MRISQKAKSVIMRNLLCSIFYMKTNVLQDFHICISVPSKREEENTIHRSGSSNFLVERTKSTVKLIIFMFSFASKAVLLNIKVCVSEKSVLPNSLWSMLTKLLRSV